jgi:hypothetical protein
MDIFIEQLVQKKPSPRDILLTVSVFAATAALCTVFIIAAFSFLGLPMLVVVPGIIWLGGHIQKGLNIEYEYILTNEELDVDKIKGKSKRKRMFTFDLGSAEKLEKCTETTDSFQADITVSAHDNTYINMWRLILKSDSHGKIVLLFNPNGDFAANLNKVLPFRARFPVNTDS